MSFKGLPKHQRLHFPRDCVNEPKVVSRTLLMLPKNEIALYLSSSKESECSSRSQSAFSSKYSSKELGQSHSASRKRIVSRECIQSKLPIKRKSSTRNTSAKRRLSSRQDIESCVAPLMEEHHQEKGFSCSGPDLFKGGLTVFSW